MIPVISLVGTSNSGKTTFMEKLLRVIKSKGYRVATIKHHHQEIELDTKGKDTWRHAMAGADLVVMATPKAVAKYEYTRQEKSLSEVIAEIAGVDIIITEGYKRGPYPKIEVLRKEVRQQLLTPLEELVAIVSDLPPQASVPSFGLEDAVGVVRLLEKEGYLRRDS